MRIERQRRRQKRITMRNNAHAGGQGRCRATGIVIVVILFLLDGDLPIAVQECNQEASGGRTPLARTDPRRHQQPHNDEDHKKRAQVSHDDVTSIADFVSVESQRTEVNDIVGACSVSAG